MNSIISNDNFIDNIPVPLIRVQLDSSLSSYPNFYIEFINDSMLNLFNTNNNDIKSAKHLIRNSYEIREIIVSCMVEHLTKFKKYIPVLKDWYEVNIQNFGQDALILYFTPLIKEYNQILNIMNVTKKMYFIKDRYGDYIDCDEKFASLANCDKSTIYKKNDVDLWGKHIGKSFTDSHNESINNKDKYIEKVFKLNDKMFNIEKYFIYSDDELLMVVGTCEELYSYDINGSNTNYKNMLRLIEDTSPDMIYYKNLDGTFLWCNKTMSDAIGLPKEDIIGKTNIQIKPLSSISKKCNEIDKEVLQFKSQKIYNEYLSIGEDEKYYEVIKAPLFDSYSNIIGLVGILRDISHRSKLDNEMDKLRLEFFANLSHELRTPINLISSSLQLIHISKKRNSLTNENFDRYLDIISQNGDRLLKLINNLIDSTKLDSNYVEYCPQNQDIIAFIEGICMTTVDFAKQNNIDLIFDTLVEEKIASFDPDKLERIILNLLSNSIKYNRPNGKIYVNLNVEYDMLEIKIRDTGIGIPSIKLNSIFDKFKQVDNRFTKVNEGSGLGLYIVKSLVDLHKGTINVASDIGVGTEFSINIPCNTSTEVYSDDFSKEIKHGLNKRIQIEFSDIY